jgi:3'-phosphoadenosine 5'-phosphosulfate (PAPS) 3'-phosphatase
MIWFSIGPERKGIETAVSAKRPRSQPCSVLAVQDIAAGEADLYPRFGTTMEWDTAAGQAILEAAGGRVETLAGDPLAYGKPGFKNDGFLAWGRRPGRG